jgi:hypothetical protein
VAEGGVAEGGVTSDVWVVRGGGCVCIRSEGSGGVAPAPNPVGFLRGEGFEREKGFEVG